MKGFHRKNQLLSLCGLNCGLCSMKLSGHCPGCGGGEGNQSCGIAKCSLAHGSIEYCYECGEYPCKAYDGIDEFDSFITHRNQKLDLEKAKRIGIEAYSREQKERVEILAHLLADFNDGRRKTFFCVAVNLLDLKILKHLLAELSTEKDLETLSIKERSKYAVSLLQRAGEARGIELKLRKKK